MRVRKAWNKWLQKEREGYQEDIEDCIQKDLKEVGLNKENAKIGRFGEKNFADYL